MSGRPRADVSRLKSIQVSAGGGAEYGPCWVAGAQALVAALNVNRPATFSAWGQAPAEGSSPLSAQRQGGEDVTLRRPPTVAAAAAQRRPPRAPARRDGRGRRRYRPLA